MSSFELGN